jgi:hypothetical protein
MANASSTIVQKLWNYCNILRDDGLSYGSGSGPRAILRDCCRLEELRPSPSKFSESVYDNPALGKHSAVRAVVYADQPGASTALDDLTDFSCYKGTSTASRHTNGTSSPAIHLIC